MESIYQNKDGAIWEEIYDFPFDFWNPVIQNNPSPLSMEEIERNRDSGFRYDLHNLYKGERLKTHLAEIVEEEEDWTSSSEEDIVGSNFNNFNMHSS